MRNTSVVFLLFVALLFSVSCSNGQKDSAETAANKAESGDTSKMTSENAPVEEVSQNVEERLVKYFKNKYGQRLPQDTTIKVTGFQSTDIDEFDKGNFDVNISNRGSQQIPFLISKDRKYMVIGVDSAANIDGFKESPVPGFKQGGVNYGNRDLPMMISNDNKHLIVGELLDTSVDPLQKVMEQISLKNVPVKGNKDAKVTVVEYSDFQCPFCKRASSMIPVLMKDYGDKISFYYKQLPLPNHDWSKSAAIAALCAYNQGNQKFWDFHDSLFYNQGQISTSNAQDKFKEFAKNIGLDVPKFESCVNSEETKPVVEEQFQEAQKLGLNSTPTFIVDGIIVPGADLNGIKNAIDSRLSEQK